MVPGVTLWRGGVQAGVRGEEVICRRATCRVSHHSGVSDATFC